MTVMCDNLVLLHGDCLEVLPELPEGIADLVLCDMPYGTTQCKWDQVIPLDRLWPMLKRVAKKNAAFVLTASQPFTSVLVMSNIKEFKHQWVWIKNRGSNFANTVREPMKEHEDVLVFSEGKWAYNKQMQERTGGGVALAGTTQKRNARNSDNYVIQAQAENTLTELRVPSSWQKFNTEVGLHPTQKPVDLMAYMIRTYSNPGETVLDFTMGSGTTGVAALKEGRNFIGIEKDDEYFRVAQNRIEEVA